MSQNDEILGELRELRREMADVKLLLGGDWKDNTKPGLIHSHAQMKNEIYNQKDGLLVRVGGLEISKREAIAYGAGAAFVVSVLFGLVTLAIAYWK